MMIGLSLAITSRTGSNLSGAETVLGGAGQGMAIDFRDMSMVIRDTGTPANNFNGDPNDALTNSSPSTKFIRGQSGVYASGTTLRTEYALNATPLGLRVEAAATNLHLNNRDWTSGSYANSNVTVAANDTTAPDGATTADRLTAAASASVNIQQSVTYTPTTASFSVFAKKGSGATQANAFRLRNTTTLTNLLDITVNYDTGAITYNTGASGATVEQEANDWWRVSLRATSGIASGNVVRCDYGFIGPANTGFYAWFWGTQLESGTTSSLITTAGTSVLRNEDVILLPFTDFPWNSGTGVLEVDGVVTTPTTSGSNIKIVPRSGQTHVQTVRWVPS